MSASLLRRPFTYQNPRALACSRFALRCLPTSPIVPLKPSTTLPSSMSLPSRSIPPPPPPKASSTALPLPCLYYRRFRYSMRPPSQLSLLTCATFTTPSPISILLTNSSLDSRPLLCPDSPPPLSPFIAYDTPSFPLIEDQTHFSPQFPVLATLSGEDILRLGDRRSRTISGTGRRGGRRQSSDSDTTSGTASAVERSSKRRWERREGR
ncbi:unnamed protein product [Linum trigynum]|uniref:Uncharacterized protein n=1 Tax=Linum trigynum TaxID=586398 RepID=A0AAV2GDC8_9ROSI